MGVKRIGAYVRSHWLAIVCYGGIAVILAVALYWRLGTLLPGYSQAELEAFNASLTFKAILDNPANAPFLLVVKALNFLHPDSLLVARLAATAFGVVALGVFALLVRHWHDARTAAFATLLFGTSAWFLHTARLGTPDVLLLGVFVLAASGFWLKKTNHWLALLTCFVLAGALLYVPGMVWFVVLGVIWQWKTIDQVFKKHLGIVMLGTLLLAAALIPLGWAIYQNPDLGLRLVGAPEQWPNALTIAENILKVPYHLFVRGAADPATWLGTTMILDAFVLAMFALGSYLYLQHFRLLRTPLIILIALIMTALIAVNDAVTLTVIMPFIYLVAAAGLAYLMGQWFKVFPRNPIAHTIGFVIVCALVAAACAYQLTHYFVGWPHAAATHEVFNVHLLQ